MSPRRKRIVRGNVRRRTPSPVVQRLNTTALLTMGFTRAEVEKLTLPTVAVHFTLVEHGYEIHVFDEGRYIGAGCRDFSGSHKIGDLKISLVQAIQGAVTAWRSKL